MYYALNVITYHVVIFAGCDVMVSKRQYDVVLEVLTHFILETRKEDWQKSAHPDQLPHNMASDQDHHCLLI